ncbi:hypothetical protein JK176_12870 [Gluconobacter sp. Dm-73]|uniref:hypothetical protein n=1 Tax=Gluconobacter sp. Dm-73 TaxID=2799802 RepID=UPI001B8C7888|nr:hypothetical protein [Gluconobacter sp. Dm-73]MBS1075772.1 hypothetical protein [Gluconobacter sp. Dm-73]
MPNSPVAHIIYEPSAEHILNMAGTYFLMLSGILSVSREATENDDKIQKKFIDEYEPHIFLWVGIIITYITGMCGIGLYRLAWYPIIIFSVGTFGIGSFGSIIIFLLRRYFKSRYTPPSHAPEFSTPDGYKAFLSRARAANLGVNSRRQASLCLIIGAGLAFLGALFALMRIGTQ